MVLWRHEDLRGFSTISMLAKCGKIDILMLQPDGMYSPKHWLSFVVAGSLCNNEWSDRLVRFIYPRGILLHTLFK
jgi:hypothetical protein